jgi:hypothetical protein
MRRPYNPVLVTLWCCTLEYIHMSWWMVSKFLHFQVTHVAHVLVPMRRPYNPVLVALWCCTVEYIHMSWWMVSKFLHWQVTHVARVFFNPSTVLGLLLLNLSTCTWPELSERRIIHHLHAIWKGTIFRKDITEKRSVVYSPHSMLTMPFVTELAIAMASLPAFFSWVQKLA